MERREEIFPDMIIWQRLWRKKSFLSTIAGYEDHSLVDVVVRKTCTICEADRIDDVLAGETLLPTLAGVAIAGAHDPIHVLDFGGAAGLHYLVAKQAFPRKRFRWAVIETAEMANAAAHLANEELRYFTDLKDGKHWLQRIDLMHCVSALQYVPEPESILESLVRAGAPSMLWAKLMLGDRRDTFVQTSRLCDNGPGPLPIGIPDRKVTYQATQLPRGEFLRIHQHEGYRLAWKARESDTFLFVKDSAA